MRLWMSCDLTFSPFSKINPISRPLPVINSAQPVEIFKSSKSLIFFRYFFSAKKSLDLLYFRFSHVFLDLSWFFVREWDEVSMRGGPRRKIFPTLWRLNRQPPKFKLGCWKTRLWMNFLLSCVLKILKMNPDFININKAGPIKSKNNNTCKIVDTCLKCHLTIRLMNLISDQSRDLYR